jgi:hypothetical protein
VDEEWGPLAVSVVKEVEEDGEEFWRLVGRSSGVSYFTIFN